MIRLITIGLLIFLASCSSISSKEAAVLDYREFGPQVVAKDVIGMEWWQWDAHGNSRPEHYDVKVVVYKGITLEVVKKRFSVNRDNKDDFRYLSYDQSLKYLDEQIRDDVVPSLTVELKKTRKKLIDIFGGL